MKTTQNLENPYFVAPFGRLLEQCEQREMVFWHDLFAIKVFLLPHWAHITVEIGENCSNFRLPFRSCEC